MSDSFADLIKPMINNKKTHAGRNQIHTVTVIDIITHNNKKYALVEAPLIINGLIPIIEFKNAVKKGDQVVAIKISDHGNFIIMSHNRAKKTLHGKELYKAFLSSSSVVGKVVSQDDVIAKVDLGNNIFGTYIGNANDSTNFYILSMPSNDKITLSLEAPIKRILQIGEIVNAKIISISNNFYLCSVDDITCIMDMNDFSWNKSKAIPGQYVQAKVIDIIKNNKHEAVLDAKVLMKNGSQEIFENSDKYLGNIYKATVTQIVSNVPGLVVQFLNTEGFVIKHETSWTYQKEDLNEKFTIGQEVDVKITKINKETKKIYLSIRETIPNPFETYISKYHVNDIVTGTILYDYNRFTHYTFVSLDNGVEAFLQMSEISWSITDREAKFQALQPGQEIKAKIINIDDVKKRISLSVKQLSESRRSIISRLIIANIYPCDVVKIIDDGIYVKLTETPQVSGFIDRSELSGKIFIGNTINAKLIEINESKIVLSMKTKAQNDSLTMTLGDYLKK